MPIATIESLDHEARGVTHAEGKTIFVEGALPLEEVEYSSFRKKPTYELATAVKILRTSSSRNTPACPHFGQCGGCSMQHMEHSAQVAAKQRVLEDALWHIGRVRPEQLYPPIYGPALGYRHRARLSVRYVPKKGGVLVGFHERKSSYIADMQECKNLPPLASSLLLPLRQLINQLSIREHLPQIEVAIGAESCVLVMRIMREPNASDQALLRDFANTHAVELYFQPKGPESAIPFHPENPALPFYHLPEYNLKLSFFPTEFTQVNPAINPVLIRRAMALLEPAPGERIADMFCGLGNFTLPIARLGATVIGIEGSHTLVKRGIDNAQSNGLAANTQFLVANLFTTCSADLDTLGFFDKMLLDPPREGAIELIKALSDDPTLIPKRLVYVSCNPATLARDATVLVQRKNYRFRGAGVVNMFPNTSHVESIALFEQDAIPSAKKS